MTNETERSLDSQGRETKKSCAKVAENTYAGISDFDLYVFNTGTGYQSYKTLGVHKIKIDGVTGWRFSVWAPNAKKVYIFGEFNEWNVDEYYALSPIGTTGVWYGFFKEPQENMFYKYVIEGCDGKTYYKSDPYAVRCEMRPGTASLVKELPDYKWTDKTWLNKRKKNDKNHMPMNIYEMNVGSWKIHDDGSFYTYEELADELVPYLTQMGYTHVELMPITEFPFDGSWGYQVTGYFAATSRYGTMEQLKYFINKCHEASIGVFMDWVPAHFPRDAHGLRMFDGGAVFEYADTKMGEHKDWGTMVFDYGKSEVVSFLMSSAYFWAKEFHFDGLRVDAVSSMLYRDYSRNDGEWTANKYGGNGNLEAMELFKNLNEMLHREIPGFLMIAEESTSWPLVTADPKDGGLGFDFKWNMGWMNDALRYESMDPYFRKDNHSLVTFLMMYAYSEKFILPLSHDEVVHGKRSLVNKMWGEYEDRFNAYRAFLGYYMSMPGKKLLFMGGEFAQGIEWRHDDQLEWNLLDLDVNQKFHKYVKDLNHFYLENTSLWDQDDSWDGFRWINESDNYTSVLSYMRRGKKKNDITIAIVNFTPIERPVYKIGVPEAGEYEVVLNSNAQRYGGTRRRTVKTYKTIAEQYSDMDYTLYLEIDPNSTMFIQKKKPAAKPKTAITRRIK